MRRTSRDRTPLVVVPALIGINVVAFIVTAVQASSIVANEESSLFQDGTLLPAFVAGGEWWRLVTSGFLHFGNYGGFGPVHLLFNMFALWIIGRDLEVALGRVRFLTVYLLALLGGSTAVMLFGAADGGVAGASGAIYGLFAGIGVVVIKAKLNPAPVFTLLAINIFLSFTLPGISLLGHLGGLVAGALATVAMVYAPRKRLREVQIGATAALAILMILAIVLKGVAMDCAMIDAGRAVCLG